MASERLTDEELSLAAHQLTGDHWNLVPRMLAEITRLRAEVVRLTALLPRCLGEWTGGSGGHRKYAGGCDRPGVWDVGLGEVCDEHKNKNGGDDNAWEWWRERNRLEDQIERMRFVFSAAIEWARYNRDDGDDEYALLKAVHRALEKP